MICPPELRLERGIRARAGDYKNGSIDPMRSTWTRVAAFGIAGAIALGTVASASAATRNKRQAAPAPAAQDEMIGQQDQMIGQDVQLAPRGNWQAVPPSALQGPYGCVTDEGYGRYSACDQGGGG